LDQGTAITRTGSLRRRVLALAGTEIGERGVPFSNTKTAKECVMFGESTVAILDAVLAFLESF
jgi:hypothetical protein